MPNIIADAVHREMMELDPELEGKNLADAMISCVEKTGKEFVFVIDEWDALIREAKGDIAVQRKYLGYLTWNEEDGMAHIPNEEVRIEFRRILKGGNGNRKWLEFIGRSRQLLEDTIAGNDFAPL